MLAACSRALKNKKTKGKRLENKPSRLAGPGVALYPLVLFPTSQHDQHPVTKSLLWLILTRVMGNLFER